MMENKSLLEKKVIGCLLGGIIGDAMGAPAEGKTYKQIAEQYGEIRDFQGSGTDDSAIRMILCQAIVENDGYIRADEFADSFLKNTDKSGMFYIPVRNMLHKLSAGTSLPIDAGYGNMQSSSSAMAISPMGIINACNPRQAAYETFEVAGIIHSGPAGFCRDAACSIAQAVAEAMKPDSTVDSVLEASTSYLHRKSAAEMRGCIGKVLELAKETQDYAKFREGFYGRYLQKVQADSRETVPCSLALFYLSGGEPDRAIIYGANFGRDADTIATMVGSISGAFKGVDGLKKEWVKKVRDNNPEQFRVADDLIRVIKKRQSDMKSVSSMIAGVMNDE
jgi:ADP-ribosylglycohydrolase